MRRKFRLLAVFTIVMVVIAMMPIYTFAGSTSSVILDKTTLTVTEGQIHKDPNAVVTATYDGLGSGSFLYSWYECDSSGNNRVKKGDLHEFRIPEELTDGTHYFVCVIEIAEIDGAKIVDTATSQIITVTVEEGIPVVILDPAGGNFAEIIDNDKPIEVKIGEDGKLSEDMPSPPGAENCMFMGWFTEEYFGEKVNPETYIFEHTTRLYAHYAQEQTAVFDANGGAFEKDEQKHTVTFADGIIYNDMMPKDPVREGYRFLGWYEKTPDGSERKLEFLEDLNAYVLVEINDYEFFAKWEKIETTEGNTTNPTVPNTSESKPAAPDAGESKPAVPKTGDNNNIVMFGLLGMLAIAIGSGFEIKNNKE